MNTTPTKNEDLAYGLKSELINKETLETFFGCGLVKTDTYHAMDYTNKDNTIFVEMKTRRINHNQYDTALIGKNKVDFCASSKAKCYFVYIYKDGMFSIRYDKALFDSFDCRDYERGQREGGIQPKQAFVFIPYTKLTRLPTT